MKTNQSETHRAIAWWACIALVVGTFATDLYLPSWPAMVQHLHTTPASIQLSLTLFYMGYGLSQPFYGPLSDRYGRKPIMLIGLTLFLVMSIFLALTHHVNALLIGRFLQGIGAGVTAVVGRSMMCDVFSGKALEKVSSLQGILWAFVPVIAPVFGGYIAHYLGWHWQFLVLGIVGLLALLGYIFFVYETHHDKLPIHVKTIAQGYAHTVKNRVLLGNVLIMCASAALIVGFMAVAPFIFQGLYHLNPVHYGWVMMLMTIGFLIGAVANRWLLNYFSAYGLNIVMTILCVLIMAALVIIPWLDAALPSLPVVIVLMFGAFVTTTILYPNAIACAMNSIQSHIGTANAFISLVAVLAYGSAPAVMSAFNIHTLLPAMIVLLILSVLIIVGMMIGQIKK